MNKENKGTTHAEQEAKLLRETQHLAHIGSWTYDLITKELFWTSETFNILGFNPQLPEPTFDQVVSCIPPEQLAETMKFFRECIRNKDKVNSYQLNFVRPDGDSRFLNVVFSIIFASNGKQEKYIGTIQDISQLRKAEENLNKSENLYRNIIDLSNIAMAIVSFDGKIEYINQQAVTTFGYLHTDIPDMDSWWRLAYPDEAYREQVINQFMGFVGIAIQEKSEIPRREYRATCKNGEIKTMVIFGVIVDDKIFVMFEDITARKKIEIELKESEERYSNLIHTIPVGVVIHTNGEIVFSNKSAAKIMEVPSIEALNNTKAIDFVHPDYKDLAIQRIKKVKADQSYAELIEEVFITFTGKKLFVEVTALPIIYNNIPSVLTVFNDINERRQVEQELSESKERFEKIFDNSPDAILLTRIHDGFYIDSNSTFTKYTGYTPKDLRGKSTLDINIWENPSDREKLLQAIQTKGYCHNLELNVKNKDGSSRTVDMSAEVVQINGVPHLLSTSRDIVERKEIEKKLKESEEKYRVVIETASDVIYTVDSLGAITALNPAFEVLTGFSVQDSIGRFFGEFIHPDDLKYALEIHNMIQTGLTPPIFELRFLFSDNSYKYVEFSVAPLYQEGKVTGTLGIGRIVQERKDAEKALMDSEAKYRILIEQAADGIFVGDQNGNFIEVNSKACSLSGYSKKDLLNMNMSELYSEEEKRRAPLRYDLLLKGETVKSERMLKRKNSSEIPVEMNTKRMPDGNYQAIIRNISERRKAEEFMLKYQEELEKLVRKRTKDVEKSNKQLKKEVIERLKSEEQIKLQLKEKEILLKEIHHRVKNNMQVIISLLNLHGATIEDNRILDIYKESQNRIKSMALIHEKLYQSRDFTHIDFSDYLSSLAIYLSHIYQIDKSSINIVTKAHKIPFEFDTAITLGLIVNELVSNAMKYAFNGNDNGKIEIELKKTASNTIQLVVSDNGCGIPKNINYRNTKSLGLQLVCTLTEQLDGKLRLSIKDGTHFKIEFPLKTKK